MSEEIRAKLSSYISRKILMEPARVIHPDEALISSGLIDSFRLIDLVLYIEDTFSVQVDDTELSASTFDTVASLSNLIELRLNNLKDSSNKDFT